MNVALVYDRVNKYGGAERILEALHTLWPDAPLYTAVYDKRRAPWASSLDVRPSFLQAIPFAKSHHEFLASLTPLAFEQFTFDAYDVVITVTSAEAKGIVTKPKTLHICYCLTPTRYLWSGFSTYKMQPGLGALSKISAFSLRLMAPLLRRWDNIAATRPDHYIAISNRVARRIKKYYGRSADVIYPPAATQKFRPAKDAQGKGEYYVAVSRLVGYKRLDIIVEAFRDLGLPLVIIGEGKQKQELMNKAAPTIRFINRHLTDSELAHYYQHCRAFIHVADEDFGISMVEAQACGKPVIAYRGSAASEIIVPGKTGILFEKQSVASLKAAVVASRRRRFDPVACRQNALRFDTTTFKQAMMKSVQELYEAHKHTL